MVDFDEIGSAKNMDESLKELSIEHENILKVIDGVLKECKEIESGKSVDKVFFKELISFIREYADSFHHAKEEDFLFVEFNKHQEDSGGCNPVKQMLHEHNLGREFVKSLKQALINSNSNSVVENARAYAFLLRDHIAKEDNILYPMADMTLNLESKKKMKKTFQDVELKFEKIKKKQLEFVKRISSRFN